MTIPFGLLLMTVTVNSCRTRGVMTVLTISFLPNNSNLPCSITITHSTFEQQPRSSYPSVRPVIRAVKARSGALSAPQRRHQRNAIARTAVYLLSIRCQLARNGTSCTFYPSVRPVIRAVTTRSGALSKKRNCEKRYDCTCYVSIRPSCD